MFLQVLSPVQLKRAESQVPPGDVDMPSAKADVKKEVKLEQQGPTDAKARIKAAILNAGLRRKQMGKYTYEDRRGYCRI